MIPASDSEKSEFTASDTSFVLTLDGSIVSMDEISPQSGGITNRYWRRQISFSNGTHTLVGRWRWEGVVIQTTTIIIRASG